MPGTTLDLFQDQVFSTVAPKTTLKETITAEDILQRKGDRKGDKLDTAAPRTWKLNRENRYLTFHPQSRTQKMMSSDATNGL